MERYDIVIIGGVAAGMSAASQARRANKELSIIVYELSDFVSYGACGIPYYIGDYIADHKKLIAINEKDFIEKRNIQISKRSMVTEVDFENKQITVNVDGTVKKVGYGKLIIATGAKPILPSIKGIENKLIYSIRNLNDALKIKECIKHNNPKKAVIIGGGYIGLEMAESLKAIRMEVTLLEKMPTVAVSMDKEVQELIHKELEENGIIVQTNAAVQSFQDKMGKVVVEYSGGEIEADMVIFAIGIRPCTAFLSGTKINRTEIGAIVVNEKSETNIADVYAAGDCATVKSQITGKDVYMPLGTTANKQGRVAGLQAAGLKSEVFNGIIGTQLVKVFDLEIGKTGLIEQEAEKLGIPTDISIVTGKSRAGYYPDWEKIFIKLIINRETRILMGGEVVGKEGAAQRTNVIAASIAAKMSIKDFAYLDLGYAPKFAPVWDPLLVAAQKLVQR